MEERRFNVIFLGPDNTEKEYVDQLMDELMDRFHLSTESVRKMMLLAPVTVKRDVNLTEANRYRKVLEVMGASVKIEAVGSLCDAPDEDDDSVPTSSYEEESTHRWEAAPEEDPGEQWGASGAAADADGFVTSSYREESTQVSEASAEEDSDEEWGGPAASVDADDDGLYNVVFTGLVDDSDATVHMVIGALEADFGLSPTEAAQVVRSPGSVVKQGVPYGQAISYWVDMEAVGGLVSLEPMDGETAGPDDRRTREERSGRIHHKKTARKSYLVFLGLVILAAGAVAAWRWFDW